MNERPILFSGPMVRAILDGRKTQTRRIVKPQPTYGDVAGAFSSWKFPYKGGGAWLWPNGEDQILKECPYGVPGDKLWVREAWTVDHIADRLAERRMSVRYRATDNRASADGMGWRPSIHMPRWASRITLEVVAVRLERLQEIASSPEDLLAEGVTAVTEAVEHLAYEYRALWDTINGPGAWDKNPWVWVIKFSVLPRWASARWGN